MDISKLSLKNISDEVFIFEPDFCYEEFHGSAELYGMGDIILFKKEGEADVSAVTFHAIIKNNNKRLFRVANKLMADMGIELKMGYRLNKIIKKFGTPFFIDYLEADYEEYYRYRGDFFDYEDYYRYPGDFYDYNDEFYIVRYHYLLSPNLLVWFGVPKTDNKLTDLEIINDYEMITEIMQARRACKELDYSRYQPKECVRYVNQMMEKRKFTRMQSKNFRLIKMDIKECSMEGIKSDDIRFRDCIFQNVTFDSHFDTCYVSIEHCTFIDCVFCDTFEDGHLRLADSLFQNCLFEGVGMEKEDGILGVNRSEFMDCTFKEIILKGAGVFSRSKIRGGAMKRIFYKNDDISFNEFSDIQIEDMELVVDAELGFFDNQLNSVVFRNATLKGLMEDNEFVNCDTSGLTYIG